MRLTDIDIHPNEILDNRVYVNGVEFTRYYHNDRIPTRYFASRDGKIYSEISNIIMKPTHNAGGYQVLGLRFKNKGKPKYVQVHKIIATVYCGGYHKGLVVDHIDGCKTNNHYRNLEWVTRSTNTKRAYDKGLHRKYLGDNNPNVAYSDYDIHKACEYLQAGYSIKRVSEITGISSTTLHSVVGRVARTDIARAYTFPRDKTYQPRNPLDDKTKEEILNLYNQQMPAKEIQNQLGIPSLSKVIHAIYDKRYKRAN